MLKPPKERRPKTCSFVLGSTGKHCNAAASATTFAFRGRRHLKSPLTPRSDDGTLVLVVFPSPPLETGAAAVTSPTALASSTGDESVAWFAAVGDLAGPLSSPPLAATSSRLARCINFIFMVSLEIPGLLAAGLFVAGGAGSLSFFLSLLFFADFGPDGLGSPGFHSCVLPSMLRSYDNSGWIKQQASASSRSCREV